MIVIIGTGPAGLGASYSLRNRDHVLLEKESEAGGLCRSFDIAGCTFDYGGHAFFTKHPEILELLTDLAPRPLNEQPRNAWVYSHGVFVPYPFQSHLFGLPVDVVEECVMGAVKRYAESAGEPSNLDEWIDAQFGDGITRHFMRPYNRKLWAHPLTDILPSWTGDRIVQPDIADIIGGALRRREYRDYPNAQVRYPSKGGFVELYRPLIDLAKPRIKHESVTLVDLDRKFVETDRGTRQHYDSLISTMPLPELVSATRQAGPREHEAVAALAYNSLHLVSLAVDKRNDSQMHRVYVSDPKVPFHKLAFNNTSSPDLAGGPHTGIQVEVSFSPFKHVDAETVVDDVVTSLIDMGLLHSVADIIASDLRTIPMAYPVATAPGRTALPLLHDFYARHNVHLCGRFAEWRYINSDTALYSGIALGDSLRETP